MGVNIWYFGSDYDVGDGLLVVLLSRVYIRLFLNVNGYLILVLVYFLFVAFQSSFFNVKMGLDIGALRQSGDMQCKRPENGRALTGF